ncbi:MAG: cytochrome P450 [Rhodobacteraceae bacterium]|nr:cytochrome P450 [Paracoccaceae bacterium]
MIPPKPASRADRVSFWRYVRLFRQDILSAQPERLYRARMAEFRTPFFHSFLCNDPALIRHVLNEDPMAFPKSARIREGLSPLLGRSIFVTNGSIWARQRRIIDPAFEQSRVKGAFPAMRAAALAARARVGARAGSVIEVEEETSHAAADVIFRTLFSIPIEDEIAWHVFGAFRDYQRSQPLLNIGALLPLPQWLPRFRKRRTRAAARVIRGLITRLTEARAEAIAAGDAPDDLATRIMTTPDPETGRGFTPAEMVDQIAIFFLAGHETSASALAWALWLLAAFPEAQARVAAEAAGAGDFDDFAVLARLPFTRDVFRETLRLYPPVPMMVREATRAGRFRDRPVPEGAQIVLSPWHMHRHERIWDNPDGFDPDRWSRRENARSAREGFLPFSQGPRVCPGAGFAMAEGTLMLAALVGAFAFSLPDGPPPVPVAHLTVRAAAGIPLRVSRRKSA